MEPKNFKHSYTALKQTRLKFSRQLQDLCDKKSSKSPQSLSKYLETKENVQYQLGDTLLISSLRSTSKKVKFSEAILMNPKQLSDGGTKLSLVDRQINLFDTIPSAKLANLQILYLSGNHLKEISVVR